MSESQYIERRIIRRKPPLCACGCGERVKWNQNCKRWNKYIHGHYNKGRKCTEKTKKKMSEAAMGENNPNYGKPLSVIIRKKISLATTGKNNPMYGKKHSLKTCKKLSEINKGNTNATGHRLSVKTRRKMSALNKGKVLSEETKRKIGLSNLGKGNSNWKGGISCEPYCSVWTDQEYKESIRKRDGNICMNPSCWGTAKRLALHHINYIKKDCRPQNLISLCTSCNSRANFGREYWTEFYQKIMIAAYEYSYAK